MSDVVRPAPLGKAGPRRADVLLTERGLVESRAKARAAIEAGLMTSAGRVVRRPSDLVDPNADVTVAAPYPWVSRGGVKLAHGLDVFGIDPRGCLCLDVGASTGGFADVLLARGAEHVWAVDVGRAQLHPRLAADPRVTSLEGTDIRRLDPAALPAPAALASVDVSFISVGLVLPYLDMFLSENAQLIVLIKPQFEVGRSGLGRGGIVRDEEQRNLAVGRIADRAAALGWQIVGIEPSPITGGDGNREFLLAARRPEAGGA